MTPGACRIGGTGGWDVQQSEESPKPDLDRAKRTM